MKPKIHKYRITNLDILKMVKSANRTYMIMPKATITNDRKKKVNKNKCRTKDNDDNE